MIQVKCQTKTMFLNEPQELYQNEQSRHICLTIKCHLKMILKRHFTKKINILKTSWNRRRIKRSLLKM
jgi:hypothetical protein